MKGLVDTQNPPPPHAHTQTLLNYVPGREPVVNEVELVVAAFDVAASTYIQINIRECRGTI